MQMMFDRSTGYIFKAHILQATCSHIINQQNRKIMIHLTCFQQLFGLKSWSRLTPLSVSPVKLILVAERHFFLCFVNHICSALFHI